MAYDKSRRRPDQLVSVDLDYNGLEQLQVAGTLPDWRAD